MKKAFPSIHTVNRKNALFSTVPIPLGRVAIFQRVATASQCFFFLSTEVERRKCTGRKSRGGIAPLSPPCVSLAALAARPPPSPDNLQSEEKYFNLPDWFCCREPGRAREGAGGRGQSKSRVLYDDGSPQVRYV